MAKNRENFEKSFKTFTKSSKINRLKGLYLNPTQILDLKSLLTGDNVISIKYFSYKLSQRDVDFPEKKKCEIRNITELSKKNWLRVLSTAHC